MAGWLDGWVAGWLDMAGMVGDGWGWLDKWLAGWMVAGWVAIGG